MNPAGAAAPDRLAAAGIHCPHPFHRIADRTTGRAHESNQE